MAINISFAFLGAGTAAAVLIPSLTAKQVDNPPMIMPVAHASEKYGVTPYTLGKLNRIQELVKQNYVDKVDYTKLEDGMLNGYVTSLDPHSNYFDAKSLKEFSIGISGSLVGIGVEIESIYGFLKVISPVEGTPADKAGIKAGDILLKANNDSLVGLPLDEAVSKIRGQEGTHVVMTVSREGEPTPLTFDIIRTAFKQKGVTSRLDKDVLYLRVSRFQSGIWREVADILNKQNWHTTKGIVLDMRNNPGGLLDEAVGLTSAFVPEDKPVVSTKGNPSQTYLTGSTFSFKDSVLGAFPKEVVTGKVPMVVLINKGSASAAEIVAGALQDYGRAKLWGDRSFGKGSVQTMFPLDESSAIKITTSRYYTPSGRSIQAEGIIPDMWFRTEKETKWSGLQDGEAGYLKHLSNDTIKDSKEERKITIHVLPDQGEKHRLQDPDDALALAAEEWLRTGKEVSFPTTDDKIKVSLVKESNDKN